MWIWVPQIRIKPLQARGAEAAERADDQDQDDQTGDFHVHPLATACYKLPSTLR